MFKFTVTITEFKLITIINFFIVKLLISNFWDYIFNIYVNLLYSTNEFEKYMTINWF